MRNKVSRSGFDQVEKNLPEGENSQFEVEIGISTGSLAVALLYWRYKIPSCANLSMSCEREIHTFFSFSCEVLVISNVLPSLESTPRRISFVERKNSSSGGKASTSTGAGTVDMLIFGGGGGEGLKEQNIHNKMTEELTVEETNALRAKLGLRPLRASIQTRNPAAAPQPVAAPAKKRAKTQQEEFDLADAKEGEVLILQDRGVLEEEGEDEVLIRLDELKKKKTANENLVSQMIKQQQQEMDEEEDFKPAAGAKLFVSDAAVAVSSQSERKPKKKKMVIAAPQVKIDRSVNTVVEEDEEDELDLLLSKQRKYKQAAAVVAPAPQREEQEEEELVPMSKIDHVASDAPTTPVAKPITMQEKSQQQQQVVIGPTAPAVQAPVEAPQPVKRFHRRSLSTTLQQIRDFEIYAKQEIIVGRAKDAKPLADLNQPGDSVILEYRDDHGRKMTTKEAYRQLKYQFRGDGPGPRKKMLREAQLQREQAVRSESDNTAGGAFSAKDLVSKVKKDHIVLWKN